MGWRGAGLKVLRWVLWILFAWVFVRGIFTFAPVEAEKAPPDPAAAAESRIALEPPGLRSFPALFAGEYLTWEPGRSSDRAERISTYIAGSLDRQAGWSAGKENIGQAVAGAWVHRVKPLADGRYLVTVAVRVEPYEQTQVYDGTAMQSTRRGLTGSVQYLGVPIAPTSGGGWVVYDYPSLLDPPPTSDFKGALYSGQETADAGDRVKTLAGGFFRAYMSGAGDISYYLAPDVRIAASHSGMNFESIGKVALVRSGSGHQAFVEVLAADPVTGVRFTYRYTLVVTEREGRWYIEDLLQRGE